MEAAIEVIIEGIKQFGGEIIGGILFAFALWIFPGLRRIFRRDDYEIHHELEEKRREEERLKAELKQREEALRQAEAQKAEEAKRRAEIECQLEEQRQKVQAQNSVEPIDAEALYEQGRKYFNYFDCRKARPLFRKAAELGHAEAQYRLGYIYELGLGCAKDFQEARRWYKKASEQGHYSAKYALEHLR